MSGWHSRPSLGSKETLRGPDMDHTIPAPRYDAKFAGPCTLAFIGFLLISWLFPSELPYILQMAAFGNDKPVAFTSWHIPDNTARQQEAEPQMSWKDSLKETIFGVGSKARTKRRSLMNQRSEKMYRKEVKRQSNRQSSWRRRPSSNLGGAEASASEGGENSQVRFSGAAEEAKDTATIGRESYLMMFRSASSLPDRESSSYDDDLTRKERASLVC